jgi:hypothetical protein
MAQGAPAAKKARIDGIVGRCGKLPLHSSHILTWYRAVQPVIASSWLVALVRLEQHWNVDMFLRAMHRTSNDSIVTTSSDDPPAISKERIVFPRVDVDAAHSCLQTRCQAQYVPRA